MRQYKHPYMNLIMTPPVQDVSSYEQYTPNMSGMKIVSDSKEIGLGESLNIPTNKDGFSFWNMSIGTIAISALVLSTLAFMALCVVVMSKKR